MDAAYVTGTVFYLRADGAGATAEPTSAAMCLQVPLILNPMHVHEVSVVTYFDAEAAAALAAALEVFLS
jgi:hypothetical protein